MNANTQLPDWETPANPPPSKLSFFAKHKLFGSANADKVETSNGTEYYAPTAASTTAPKAAGTGFSAGAAATTAARPSLAQRFDGVMPPNKRYFGRSRKTVLLIALGVFLALLVLILGLAIGLSKKHSSHKALPLPGNTDTFTGDLTYYATGLGACGITSSASDSICAVSHIIFDAASTSANPNDNPLCNKKIRITRYNSSKGKNASVDVTVVDRCVGCAADDLDLSTSVFDQLADESLGRVTGSWAWLD